MNVAICSHGSVSKADRERPLTGKESGHNFVSAIPPTEMKKHLKVLPIKESGAEFVKSRLN